MRQALLDHIPAFAGRRAWPRARIGLHLDPWLLGSALTLLALGLVMVASSSLHLTTDPWYYTKHQAVYIVMGIVVAALVSQIRLAQWERWGPLLLMGSLIALVLVLIPGIGREVNGARRWINLVIFNLQPSELMKLAMVVYMAGYLIRRGDEVRTSVTGFLKPIALIAITGLLLLVEPDFGATAVIALTVFAMMFIGGVRLWQFGAVGFGAAAVLGAIAISQPYRMERLTSFLNPWADVDNTGYQLAQALIAIGRGEWFGVGLGNGIQKLFYLPEAHTDFLFAVLAEETGVLGSVIVITLFTVLVVRALIIAYRAERRGAQFAGYVAYGLGISIGMQAFVNIGVNMGVLPTKGLTLPLMSYGGSSMIMACVAVGLLLRISHEVEQLRQQHRSKPGTRAKK